MKKIFIILGLGILFNGCAIQDYYTGIIEDVSAEIGKDYIEAVTGEEFNEDKVIKE